MRFRQLSLEELELLKDDFIKFLASNTVTAEDWVKTKKDKPEKAQELIEVFSDIVMEKVYSKVVLLEKREKNNLLFFRFEGDLMQILGVSTPNETVDFVDSKTVNQIQLEKIKLEGFRTSKVLEKNKKAEEVHFLIESGAFMGNEKLYETLDAIIE